VGMLHQFLLASICLILLNKYPKCMAFGIYYVSRKNSRIQGDVTA
jgi:hypothetical protein